MKLELTKPIVFFDIESTGLDVAKDRIVEISTLKVFPDGNEMTKTWVVNPGIPINPQASKIHGFSDADVADKQSFKDIVKEIIEVFKGSDVGGYNSNKFDIPLLAEELLRADTDYDIKKSKFIDVQVVFFKKEQRTLAAAYEFYCNKKLENAHSAEADIKATWEVLQAQLEMYKDLPSKIDKLSAFTTQNKFVDFAGRLIFDSKGNELFNFGKHKGKKVVDVLNDEPGYYSWIVNNDFPLYTKKVLTAIKLRTSFGNVK
ncbi:MAG: 3'-5' exonuclease [Bacteroidales bacterium]|nr:3'-5' exonuclease [Bacteroidales bacterium]